MVSVDENQKNKCCGCTACASVCPKNAIEMVEDNEGFKYPKVDKTKCINCNLCEKVCPYINKKKKEHDNTIGFLIQNKNKEVLSLSTSGGFFDSISKYVISENGFVCGATFDDNFVVKHEIYNDFKKIKKFRESKYVQSDLNGCFVKIKKLLDSGNLVCFSGTPCQVEGLKGYLRKDYDNLITVDFCCRSVPSPKLFEEYKKYQEKRYKSKIVDFHFRKKTYGYHHGTLRIKFANGREYNGSNRVDLYNKIFHSDKCSRLSCYNCVAKGINRNSDFTIFDSWNPSILNKNIKDNNLGYTTLLIHSKKGTKLFEEKLKNDFFVYEINVYEAKELTGGMLENSIKITDDRKEFYNNLIKDGYKNHVLKYINVSLMDYIIEKTKVIIYKKNR